MRSLFRTSDLNRIVTAYKRRRKQDAQMHLVAMQGGNKKELDPTYSLQSIKFDSVTRMAKIEFLQQQNYRTVERYITQNYVKYPIYSGWKTRTKVITKSIKLTNRELENLNRNSDILIKNFAGDIILALNDKALYPSWFLAECLKTDYQDKISDIDVRFLAYKTSVQNTIKEDKSNICKSKSEILTKQALLKEKQKALKKINGTLNKIECYKPSILKSIITLFIYNYLKSSKRKARFLEKQNKVKKAIVDLENAINKNNFCISECTTHISEAEKEIEIKQAETENIKRQETEFLESQLREITPLPEEYNDKSDFVPLKSLVGYSYTKIIGCYVIRNIINGKCYVGQSKDVLKRLHQHFKRTTPNNVIFAEDYYMTPQNERDNLFEVRIIRCQTKDELDRTEKQLIFDYEAFTKGYNGTNGNT